MFDEYAVVQHRNWFNDSYQRVTYGLSQDKACGVRNHIARLIHSVVIPGIVVLLFPSGAIYLTHAATTDPSKMSSMVRVFCWEAFLILLVSCLWVLLQLRFFPGRRYDGPDSGNGLRPTYKRNGFAFFLLTFAIVGVGSWLWGPSAFTVLPGLCVCSVAFSILASFAAYVKARVAPDPSECSDSVHFISDVFHGLELYPRIGGLHLKQASIRLGAVLNLMVLWSCFSAQRGPGYVAFVIIGVQFLHAGRRHWNEECYAHSLEVAYYKLGMQELLRHLVLKPFVLNVGTISTVYRPVTCRPEVVVAVCLISTTSIIVTYLVDHQKFLVKYRKGKCMTWGRTAKTVLAFYVDEHGLRRASPLLFSGFWGLARHLNYTLEFITYSALSAPALCNLSWFSSIPPALMLATLLHRAQEDFGKCRRKYGPYWVMYSRKVPHTYIPWLW